MEDKKKKRSPKPCLTQPAQAPGTLRRVPVPTSHSGSLALGLPHLPSPKQRAKFKRVGKEKCRPVLAGSGGCSAGTPLQHSFLTEVTDVYEMEGGLLNLLNDFHSGRLQAFGKECSFEQLEHVREMQEKLARLHFSLDVCGEEEDEEEEDGVTEGLPEEQKKTMADRNLDQLLSNLEDLSNSMYPFQGTVLCVFGETKPVQDGQTGLERLGSKASQSLTGTDRSCIWPRTPSLRSSQPCRCRTQAQTAPLMPFKL
ncbi:coiled-coil domain-containing protein 28B isoform X1 [Leptonychotes weddellii]|uniref:Coiled-coil domain-containing protein 28B isoform X1 n=1 Tax=Leptonychotes weddellii TaxID=9713 RepID=A0A2U3XS30_LEPWE|nr:coiled-coil domain-containing protein 28B isoform X1 [Leptonychotes weddellii]